MPDKRGSGMRASSLYQMRLLIDELKTRPNIPKEDIASLERSYQDIVDLEECIHDRMSKRIKYLSERNG
jgi:hypothetical protein